MPPPRRRAPVNLLWALARDDSYSMDGIFLYADAADGRIDASLFRDDGCNLVWCPVDRQVHDALVQHHRARAPDDRWATLIYAIEDNQASTAILRADEIGPALSRDERRAAVLARRFGDRPFYD